MTEQPKVPESALLYVWHDKYGRRREARRFVHEWTVEFECDEETEPGN